MMTQRMTLKVEFGSVDGQVECENEHFRVFCDFNKGDVSKPFLSLKVLIKCDIQKEAQALLMGAAGELHLIDL